jgi:hypothetical protein
VKRNERFGSEADIPGGLRDVRFTPKSGHWLSACEHFGIKVSQNATLITQFMALRKSEPSELHRQEAYRPQTGCCPTAPSMGRALGYPM